MKRLSLLMVIAVFVSIQLHAQKRDTVIIKSKTDTVQIIVNSKPSPPAKVDKPVPESEDIPEPIEVPEPPELPEPPEMPEMPEAPEPLDVPGHSHAHINKEPKKLKDVKIRWVMVDYGISTYTANGSPNLPAEYPYEAFEQNLWKSSNWNLHLFKMRINAIRHHINIITGLSFEFYRYNWVNDYVITEGNPSGSPAILPVKLTDVNGQDIKFEKNRMYSSFLTIPLMLNFESKPHKLKNSFHLSAGGFAGFKLASNVRLKGAGIEKLDKENFNMNNFRYGLTGQIGYGPVTFYANYSLVPLFKNVSQPGGLTQPELFPLNFGVQLIGF